MHKSLAEQKSQLKKKFSTFFNNSLWSLIFHLIRKKRMKSVEQTKQLNSDSHVLINYILGWLSKESARSKFVCSNSKCSKVGSFVKIK